MAKKFVRVTVRDVKPGETFYYKPEKTPYCFIRIADGPRNEAVVKVASDDPAGVCAVLGQNGTLSYECRDTKVYVERETQFVIKLGGNHWWDGERPTSDRYKAKRYDDHRGMELPDYISPVSISVEEIS